MKFKKCYFFEQSLDFECAPNCEQSTPYYPPSLTPSQSEAESRASSPRQTKKKKADNGKQKIPRHKRESHINAEHRRRFKIQVGFARIWQVIHNAFFSNFF